MGCPSGLMTHWVEAMIFIILYAKITMIALLKIVIESLVQF